MPEIKKPALGRVADSRLTADFIASDARFAGCQPFDPAVDVDIVDEMNAALKQVEAAATAHSGTGGDITFTNSMTVQLQPAQTTVQREWGEETLNGMGGVVRALDGDGKLLPGGLVRLAYIITEDK